MENIKSAYFSGGCFWCTEHDFRSLIAVNNVTVGFCKSLGNQNILDNNIDTSYEYREAAKVNYKCEEITFKRLIQFFLDHIDPTDSLGQFYDRGIEYTTAIYYDTQTEKIITERLLKELEDSMLFYPAKINVKVLPFIDFYPAESEHQNFAENYKSHYELYANLSGRSAFVNKTCELRKDKKIKWKD